MSRDFPVVLIFGLAVALVCSFALSLTGSYLSDTHLVEVELNPQWQEIKEALDTSQDQQQTLADLTKRLGTEVYWLESGYELEEGEADITLVLSTESEYYIDITLANGDVVEIGPYSLGLFYGYIEFWMIFIGATLVSMSVLSLSFFLNKVRSQSLLASVAKITHADYQQRDPIHAAKLALEDVAKKMSDVEEEQKHTYEENKELLANVAHEFRNPLARLKFANDLAMEETGEAQAKLYETANEAITELDQLVRETLSYSRLRYGQPHLEIVSTPLDEFVESLSSIKKSLPDHIEFTIQQPQTSATLLADIRMLNRAVTNLIVNASKYAASAIRLELMIKPNTIIITIEDDGPGIPLSDRERIFEPFYRLELSRSRDSGGFGLGLSIVQSICEQHGASVAAVAHHGGAKFEIEWPQGEVR